MSATDVLHRRTSRAPLHIESIVGIAAAVALPFLHAALLAGLLTTITANAKLPPTRNAAATSAMSPASVTSVASVASADSAASTESATSSTTTRRIARAPSPITDADIERARRATRLPSQQDIEAARRKHGVASGPWDSPGPQALPSTLPPKFAPRSTTAAAQPAPPSAPQTVHIERLPVPSANRPIDLEAIAQGYASQVDAVAALGSRSSPALFVFVTLSMPPPTLVRLIDQCARARATLVLRGLKNGSLRETAALVAALLGNTQVNLQIDPQAFDRFAITRVPAFVLVRDGARPDACARGSCPPPADFLRVAGDVSLDYALGHMQRAQPAFRGDAEAFLTRLNLHSSAGHSPGLNPGFSARGGDHNSGDLDSGDHDSGDHNSRGPRNSDRHHGTHDVATDSATALKASSGPGAGAQD